MSNYEFFRIEGIAFGDGLWDTPRMEHLLIFGIVLGTFTLCFCGMAIGLIIRGRVMRGGCGDEPHITEDGRLASCGACPKKEIDLCETDDTMGTATIASLGTLGRFEQ